MYNAARAVILIPMLGTTTKALTAASVEHVSELCCVGMTVVAADHVKHCFHGYGNEKVRDSGVLFLRLRQREGVVEPGRSPSGYSS